MRCIMQRMLLTLDDGTTVSVRPIAPEDKPLLVAGLQKLSARTVYRRFMSPKTSFTDDELRYLTEVDGHDHIALVAIGDHGLVAVARCVRVSPDTADMAIVVGDPWQGLGLGRQLARLLAMAAAAQGIKRFAGSLLADNRPALRIMKGIGNGFEVDELSHGVREVVTRLAA